MPDAVPAQDPGSGRVWHELARACRHPLRLVGALVTRVQDDDIMTTAAALAYYFFFSIFPFLLFLLALTTVLPVRGLEAWLLENVKASLPASAYALVERTVRSLLATRRGGLVSLGAALALWSASAAFAALMNGLNRAYRVRDPRPWWRTRLQAIGLTVALSLFMITAFVLTVFGGQLVALVGRQLGPAAGIAALVVRWTVTVGAVVLVVAAVYYACPAVPRRWRWVTPGTALFTLGFAGSSAAFSYYVGRFASYDTTYGSLGAVIILLFWTYILALFLLLGGELEALLAARSRAADALPDDDAPTIGVRDRGRAVR
jgi:membrane protein